jgi:IS30 family transposase
MYESRSCETREGLDVSAEDIERSEAIIKEGFEKGQGLDHIFFAHRDELAFSRSSFYRHVKNGNMPLIPLNLRKAVRYKQRNKNGEPSRTNIPPEILEGRCYEDFLALEEDEQARAVECDCVEGPASENDALLTLHFKALHFQIAFKLEVKDSAHVLRCFEWLAFILGDEFSRYFGILKFDRGGEFVCVLEIEALAPPGEVRAFFTDRRHPEQKGSAEKLCFKAHNFSADPF